MHCYSCGRGQIPNQTLDLFADHAVVGAGMDTSWTTPDVVPTTHNLILGTLAPKVLISGFFPMLMLLTGIRRAWTPELSSRSLNGLASLIFVPTMLSGIYCDSCFVSFLLLLGTEATVTTSRAPSRLRTSRIAATIFPAQGLPSRDTISFPH